MPLLTQWTWVWVDSGSWGWTERPGVLQFMGVQRVRHDWATELNWTTLLCFPDGSADKESACNVGDLGWIPGLGRSPGEWKGYPLQYSGLENSMDCNSPWGCKELDTMERLSLPWVSLGIWLCDQHFTWSGYKYSHITDGKPEGSENVLPWLKDIAWWNQGSNLGLSAPASHGAEDAAPSSPSDASGSREEQTPFSVLETSSQWPGPGASPSCHLTLCRPGSTGSVLDDFNSKAMFSVFLFSFP